MLDISTHSAVFNSIAGNAILAAIFLYLWRVDRRERALGIWAAAYAASACRVAFRLAALSGMAEAVYGEALFGAAAIVLLWLGTREFVGAAPRHPWAAGLAALAVFGAVSGLAAAGAIPLVVPYLIAGLVFLLAGSALLRRGKDNPGVGYGLVGVLFALYGGYVFVFSELASRPDDPRAYVFGPIINLAIGMLLLVVAQRKQQFAAVRLGEALRSEAADRRTAEAGGMESEQRFRAILDSTRSLIGLLSAEGTVLEVNRAALERAGLGREAVVGRKFWDTPWWAHDPEQQLRLKQAIRRVAAGGHDRFEAHGRLGHFDFFLTPIRAASGQVLYLVPEGHDITARKQVEQTLHATEQRFRAISEGSMLGVFAAEPAGQVTYLTRRASEITGVSEAEAIAGRWPDYIHPDDLAQQRAQWRQAMAERKSFVGERRYLRRDGSLVWARVHVAPIIEGDELRGFVGTIEDITARKQIEQALRDSEEKFSSFFALTPEPIAVCFYPGGEYAEVNEAWCHVFGFEQAEVIGRTGLDLGLWEEAEDRHRFYDQLSRCGEIRNAEIRFRRRDGRFVTTLASAKVIDFGGNQRILWNVHDLTAQRLLEYQHGEAERALRESEERLSRVFYLLPDLVTISSIEDGRFVDMNHQWEAMTGYTREEAIGTPIAQMGIWVDPEQRRRLVEDVLRDGLVRSREIWIRRKDWRQMICETSGSTFEWHGQRLLLLVTRDMTEKRRAEDALRVSQEKFAKAFLGSPDYISISRLSDGRLIEVNEAFERFTGYSRAEAIGRTAVELDIWAAPENRAVALNDLASSGALRDYECMLRSRDGQVHACLITCSTIEISGETCMIGIVRDITEQRRVEQALRESEEKFSAIFHFSPVALGVTSIPEGRYLDVNEAWSEQFGFPRESMIGRTSLDIGLWADSGERSRLFDDLAQHSQVRNREVHFRRSDGTDILCELSGHVFELHNEPVLIWSAHDVTEHRRVQEEIRDLNVRLEARVRERTVRLQTANEELASALEALKLAQDELVRTEKLAALGSLVAGVAHELNTPIGNSVTVASTLQDKTRDFSRELASGQVRRSSLEAYLDGAHTAAELLMRSLAQANELVGSFKQVAVDQTSAQRRRFGLRLVVEEVMATLSPILKKTPFKFELDIDDKTAMNGFPGPLGQVITNLVTNSLAHGFEGRKQGLMRLAARSCGPDSIELIFSDDGIGIPEADLRHIFDPFFTTKLGRGGSGLGLHIVHNIVTRVLGGRIRADSGPGAGTRFTLTLPVTAPEAGERKSLV